MLLRMTTLEGIRQGTIDLAFRRFKRPTVKTGGRLRTRIGELSIDKVERVTLKSITAADARRAGAASLAELLAELRTRQGPVYRIELHFAREDTRTALRAKARLTAAELGEVRGRLERMDTRSKDGAWTRRVLELIRDHPGTRAPDLAAGEGLEPKSFKARVRRLKELGLTESLRIGYRLSPRGRAVLRALADD